MHVAFEGGDLLDLDQLVDILLLGFWVDGRLLLLLHLLASLDLHRELALALFVVDVIGVDLPKEFVAEQDDLFVLLLLNLLAILRSQLLAIHLHHMDLGLAFGVRHLAALSLKLVDHFLDLRLMPLSRVLRAQVLQHEDAADDGRLLFVDLEQRVVVHSAEQVLAGHDVPQGMVDVFLDLL